MWKKSQIQWSIYKYPIIFFIISLILGGIYFYASQKSNRVIIDELIWAVSTSFFLAGLMTFSVERLNSKNIKELVKDEISKISLGLINLSVIANQNNNLDLNKNEDGTSYISELGIKDKKFTSILMDIAGDSHYRENYCITIENITDDKTVDIMISYNLHNLKSQDQKRPFNLDFDKGKEFLELQEFKIQDKSEADIIFLDKKKLDKIKKDDNKTNFGKYKIDYIIKAEDTLKFEYKLKYQSKMQKSDNFFNAIILNSKRITKNLTIKIKQDLEKKYKPIFTDYHNLETQKKVNTGGYNCYKFNGYILPYQGFDVNFVSIKN